MSKFDSGRKHFEEVKLCMLLANGAILIILQSYSVFRILAYTAFCSEQFETSAIERGKKEGEIDRRMGEIRNGEGRIAWRNSQVGNVTHMLFPPKKMGLKKQCPGIVHGNIEISCEH